MWRKDFKSSFQIRRWPLKKRVISYSIVLWRLACLCYTFLYATKTYKKGTTTLQAASGKGHTQEKNETQCKSSRPCSRVLKNRLKMDRQKVSNRKWKSRFTNSVRWRKVFNSAVHAGPTTLFLTQCRWKPSRIHSRGSNILHFSLDVKVLYRDIWIIVYSGSSWTISHFIDLKLNFVRTTIFAPYAQVICDYRVWFAVWESKCR